MNLQPKDTPAAERDAHGTPRRELNPDIELRDCSNAWDMTDLWPERPEAQPARSITRSFYPRRAPFTGRM